jgi:phosphatidylglycerophosphate synthase
MLDVRSEVPMTVAIVLATGGPRDGARLRTQLASINVPDVREAEGAAHLARLVRRAGVPVVVLPDDLVVSTGLLDRLVHGTGKPLTVMGDALLRFEPSEAAAVAEAAESLPETGEAWGALLDGLRRSGRRVAESPGKGEVCRRGVHPRDVQEELEAAEAAFEERKRMATAVKSGDGFFATFAVSSYSPHLVRLLAARGIAPNTVTGISMLTAVLAALWFSAGSRPAMIIGAVLCYFSFVLDCVDGQLARYTGRTSDLGAYLDAVGDRAKEYVIYLGLAFGATGEVWAPAVAAMILQTVRHMIDFAFQAVTPTGSDGDLEGAAGTGEAAVARLSRRTSGMRPLYWAKKMIVLPIGERFALIALTAAFFDARVTFIALLAWGTVAALYTLAGRTLRSLAAPVRSPASRARTSESLRTYRDDGPISLLLGRLTRGHSRDRRVGWLVPPGIRAIEYGYLAVLGYTQDVPGPLVFVLIAVLAYHHYDIVYRARQGHRPPEWLVRAGLGWDGRMVIVALAGLSDLLPFAYATFAVYLGVMFVADSVRTWAPSKRDAVSGAARRERGHVTRKDGRDGVKVDLEKEDA